MAVLKEGVILCYTSQYWAKNGKIMFLRVVARFSSKFKINIFWGKNSLHWLGLLGTTPLCIFFGF